MEPTLDEVKEWLQKAHNDLRSAQILTEHRPPVLDTACFHCQQAVEKTLKAFLAWQTVPFEKVHNLTYLLDLCEAQESGFDAMRMQAEALAPYAVETRYPGPVIEIPQEQAQEALEAAQIIWDFMLRLLPNETHP